MTAREGLRRHEAAHTACALWFGGRPIESVRVDHPEPDIAGLTSTGLERDLGPET